MKVELVLSGDEQFYCFIGAYGHQVELNLFPSKKATNIGHVVILALYKDQWLFTVHKKRGVEWPGGKVEQGETPLEAALRELFEETGGKASSIWHIGHYKVTEQSGYSFVKNIYVALISHIEAEPIGYDVTHSILVPLDVDTEAEPSFSPLVQDGVFSIVRNQVLCLTYRGA